MQENSFVQIDSDIQSSGYFPEDDSMCSIRNFLEYDGMLVCIDSFENGLAQGRLYTNDFEDFIPFLSLDQLLFSMEDVMDRTCNSQPWVEKRSFGKAKVKQKTDEQTGTIIQSIASVCNLHTIHLSKGRVASFSIRVHSRMHCSMQGIVMMASSSKRVAFRSELELLYLIREGLSQAKKKK